MFELWLQRQLLWLVIPDVGEERHVWQNRFFPYIQTRKGGTHNEEKTFKAAEEAD
jgi:hypothetical protein